MQEATAWIGGGWGVDQRWSGGSKPKPVPPDHSEQIVSHKSTFSSRKYCVYPLRASMLFHCSRPWAAPPYTRATLYVLYHYSYMEGLLNIMNT